MDQLPRLKERISSLGELQSLFRALRVMAASRVQESREAIESIHRYVGTVEGAIAEAALLAAVTGLSTPRSVPRRSVRILVCSEHGFIGDYNERVFRAAAMDPLPRQEWIVVGRQGAVIAERSKRNIAGRFSMATHLGGIPPLARHIAERIADSDSVDIVFAKYEQGGRCEIELKQILPLDLSKMTARVRRTSPIVQLPPMKLLSELAGEYLFAEIARALLDSIVSENVARLRTMENADHNITDKLDELQRQERTLSQEAITSELFDVVIGADAVFARGSA